jgi:hypothetical protein
MTEEQSLLDLISKYQSHNPALGGKEDSNPWLATRGLDYEHMIKARAHKGGVRIGKTPKKLASIC